MFPVILVLSHTLTNTREKIQICMTDFWNRQNNLFEFCSHLTAGVQEESVESKNLYLFTEFFSQNRIPIIFYKKHIIKWTVQRPCWTLKLSRSTFCYPSCKPDREKGLSFTFQWEFNTVSQRLCQRTSSAEHPTILQLVYSHVQKVSGYVCSSLL